MRWISSTKLKIGGMIVAGTLVSGLGSAVLFNGVAHGDWDLTGLSQQVQHLTEVTDNHESRINNAENNIKTLQATTSTAPAPSASPVPEVVTQPAPQTAPQVAGAQTVAVATPLLTAPAAPYITNYYLANGGGCPYPPYYVVDWSVGSISQQSNQPSAGKDITSTTANSCAPHGPIAMAND